MNFFFLTKLILVIALFIGIFNCKNPVEVKCDEICTFTMSCLMNSNSEHAILINKKLLDSAKLQCEGACTMFQDEFLTCKEEHPNSCEKFYSCLITSGLFN
ncbi:MAG: Cys-rich protein [Leptospiraceae bacterium]|nr:Cys-rich protein [Leptospiraceae bacterium]